MMMWFMMVRFMMVRFMMVRFRMVSLMMGMRVSTFSRESVNLMLKIEYLFWSQFLQCQQSRQVLGYVVEILLKMMIVFNMVVLFVMSNQSDVFVEDGCMMVWIMVGLIVVMNFFNMMVWIMVVNFFNMMWNFMVMFMVVGILMVMFMMVGILVVMF